MDWSASVAARENTWLVTGGAGFIGSHLVEHLLALGQRVRCLDDFSTGKRANLGAVGALRSERFTLVEGDIRDPSACREAARGANIILHEAALGSVPRSLKNPLTSHDVNVTGFLNVLEAAKGAGIRRVVYASSSSVYGDHPVLPKVEDQVGRPLSPYAVTKYADELYAHVFGKAYGLELIGLRYFNVFGPRQDCDGPYAAVIPIWFRCLFTGTEAHVNGDGETSRDFCNVANVVQANLLAATTTRSDAIGRVYNIACGERTTLSALFEIMKGAATSIDPSAGRVSLSRRSFREGDVRHSLADITRACTLLDYRPEVLVAGGITACAPWFYQSVNSVE